MLNKNLDTPWWALRWCFGVVPVVAGLDKFTNMLTDWTQYLNPLVERIIPISSSTFMHVAGVIEIGAGVLIMTKYTRFAAYIVSGWLALIALSLLFSGRYLDVAVRDLVMAVGAFALARMTEVRENSVGLLPWKFSPHPHARAHAES